MKIESKPDLVFDNTDPRVYDIEAFPMQAAPLAVKLLLRRIWRGSWEPESYVAGRDMIARAIVSIYQGQLSPTAQAVDRIYRLLDASLYGRSYGLQTIYGEDGEILLEKVVPEIPKFPTSALGGGMWKALEVQRNTFRVLDNGINGTLYPEFQSSTAIRNQLAEIIQLLQTSGGGELDEEILEQLILIAGAL